MVGGVSGVANHYTYTGRSFDHATGYLYYRYRLYDPEQGRFINQDPIGLLGGNNRYAYVEANPLYYCDGLGLSGGLFGSLHDRIYSSDISIYGSSSDDGINLAAVALNQAKHDPIAALNETGIIATQAVTTGLTEVVQRPAWLGNGMGKGVVSAANAVANPVETMSGIINAPGNIASFLGALSVDPALQAATLDALMNEQNLWEGAGELLDTVLAGAGIAKLAELRGLAKCAKAGQAAEDAYDAIGSTGKIGENELARLGGVPHAFFPTNDGTRFVDRFVNGVAHESKVGYQTLTPEIRRQIAKDAYLLQNNKQRVTDVVWHFYRSPVTGRIGGSGPLIQELWNHGITTVYEFLP